MPTLSKRDHVICAQPACDLRLITNEAGTQAYHWLERDQMDRRINTEPGASDSPVRVWALDTEGVAHAALQPVHWLARLPLAIQAALELSPR